MSVFYRRDFGAQMFRPWVVALVGVFFALASHAYTAQSYVRNGLIAQWDGIDNAGTGTHVAATNRWTDLVGNRDLIVNSGATFQGGAYLERTSSAPSDSRMAYYTSAVTTAKTIEIVIKRNAYAQYAVVFSPQGYTTGFLAMKQSTIGSNFSGYKTAADACNGTNATIALLTATSAIYQNGVECPLAGGSEGWSGGVGNGLAIGGRATSGSNAFYGRVYAVRLYDRELEPEELAWNAFVDDFRFFGGDQGTCSLTVVGDPLEYGSPLPGYGVTEALSPGDAFQCVVPQSVTITGGRATCIGYQLETNAPASDAWCPWKSGTENAFDYVHPDQKAVRLTWCWNAEASFCVSSPVVAAVSPCDARFNVAVLGLGSHASATLRLEYGTDAARLDKTRTWPAAVTQPCVCAMTIDGLLPNTAYYVRALLDAGSETNVSSVVSFVTESISERFLPQAYRTLEYLASSGSQYIDTGVVGGGTTRCLADMMWTGNLGDNAFIGARRENQARYYLVHCYNGWCLGYGDAFSDGGVVANMRYQVETLLSAGTQHLKLSGITVVSGSRAGPVETGLNLYLFAMNDGGSPYYYASARCYALKLWKGDELVRDYVPCLRRSDNAPGLYDYVSDTFVTAGGTAFAAHTAYGRDVYAAEADDENLMLTLSPAEQSSDLYHVYGSTYGGTDPSAWGTCIACGTVAASAEAATNAVPAGWGETVKVLRAFLVTGAVTNWGPTVVYRDAALPQVSGVAVDGTAGDTLVVTGSLDYFPGDDCTLRVLVGDSAMALDRVWTNLTGSVRTETGPFTLTLHKDDPSDPFYVRPGVTHFVSVEATSDGASARSAVVEVRTVGAAALSGVQVTGVNRHTVSFAGVVDDLGIGGETELSLWAGATDDPATFICVEPVQTKTQTGSFGFSHYFPDLEVTRYWQFRAANVLPDGIHSVTSATAVLTCYTKDSANYTWKTSVTSGNWKDAANWDNDKGGDCVGYPDAASSRAIFPANAKARIVVADDVRLYELLACAKGLDLVISAPTGSKMSGSLTVSGDSKAIVSHLRFENVTFRPDGGFAVGSGIDLQFSDGGLTAGHAEVCVPTFSGLNADIGAATVLIENGAQFSPARDLGLAQGGVITVRNGSVSANRILFNWRSGGGLLRIEGTNSVVTGGSFIRNAWDHDYETITNRFGGIVFAPPAEGYVTPPVKGAVTLGAGAGTKLNIYVDGKSGVFRSGAVLDQRLTACSSVSADSLEIHAVPEPWAAKSFFYWTKSGRVYTRVQTDDAGSRTALYGHFNGRRGMLLRVR